MEDTSECGEGREQGNGVLEEVGAMGARRQMGRFTEHGDGASLPLFLHREESINRNRLLNRRKCMLHNLALLKRRKGS